MSDVPALPNQPWTWNTKSKAGTDALDSATLVLVHGAWHSAACWAPLIPLLATNNLTVRCPDLPGHGSNPCELESLTLPVYTRFLADYILALDSPVTLVGHSMAGMVISQVAQDIPAHIKQLVYLSAYLPADGQSLFDLIALNHRMVDAAPVESIMTMSRDKRRASIPPEQITPLFYNRTPAAMSSYIPTAFPEEATLPLSGKVQLSEDKFGSVPRMYISCLDDRVIPVRHQRLMLQSQGCNEMIQLDADHSPFISCPETLAALLTATAT